MKKYSVEVIQLINITIDESKFTPEFMKDFNSYMFEFKGVEEHIKFIVEKFADGTVSSENDFLEGYGILSEFGIKLEKEYIESEICD